MKELRYAAVHGGGYLLGFKDSFSADPSMFESYLAHQIRRRKWRDDLSWRVPATKLKLESLPADFDQDKLPFRLRKVYP